ncbi:MAG: rod shape-determining protein MreC [Chitinispirillaceae bacterium]
MHWILEFVIRNRNICSLLFTTVLSLIMISQSPEMQATTARYLKFTLFYPAHITVSQLSHIGNIYSENKRLKKELAQTSARIQLLREQALENQRLRGLLHFAEQTPYELVPVRVIARDPSQFYRSIVVDAGRRQGVLQYMPLVGEHGVVGKVVQVMGNMSLVQLLRDPSNRTSVLCQRTRTVGIMETENGNDFFVRLRSHEDVQAGDTVVTSGLGGVYPKGLVVGVVSEIRDNHNPLFKKAFLDLTVRFDKLEELFIMRLAPRWATFRSELDSLEVLE